MELYSAEAKAIGTQIAEWLEHPEYELEAAFGYKGIVDATTFITVTKRLRAKGFTSIPQEDRLTITTKENIRFTLSGIGVIQRYCTSDTLSDLPFTAMIKDRTAANANVELDEYNIRIKTRRELPLANDDAAVKRLLEMWDRVPKPGRGLVAEIQFHAASVASSPHGGWDTGIRHVPRAETLRSVTAVV